MDAAVPSTRPGRFRPSPTGLGAIIGFALGLLLALAGVTTSVPFESDAPRFSVRVLGVVVYRYPEDGDFLGSKGRPVPQWLQARNMMVIASAVVCCAVGWAAGFAFGRLARAARDRRHVPSEESQPPGVPPPEGRGRSIEEEEQVSRPDPGEWPIASDLNG